MLVMEIEPESSGRTNSALIYKAITPDPEITSKMTYFKKQECLSYNSHLTESHCQCRHEIPVLTK